MGASVSKNILRLTTEIVAKISTKIILQTKLSEDSSQIISVKHINGDVHISGNRFYQTATINMKALLKALSSESAQQELLTELTQSAKSITSGINLGQYSDAQNLMNLLVKSTISLVTTMETSCSAFINQTQSIIIERVKGNVYIQNNIFTQVQNVLQSCVERATSASSAFQHLEEKLKQEATAKSEGISAWILVALLAVFLGVPVVGGVVMGKTILKIIFPLIMVAGAVLLVLYFAWTHEEIKVLGYTQGIQKLCGLKPAQTIDSQDSIQAEKSCQDNDACKAYDWRAYTADGKFVPDKNPKGYIYTQFSDTCIKELNNGEPDHSPVTGVPKFTSGKGAPASPGAIGDAYLDTQTSSWYKYTDQLTWARMDTFVPGGGVVLGWGEKPPATGRNWQVFITYDPTNPSLFTVLTWRVTKWVSGATFRGPGLVADAPKPNVTGYKYKAKRSWALYGGIAGLTVGLIGSIYALTMKAEEKKV